jgi:type 1 fimbriae regulatory protein FimB
LKEIKYLNESQVAAFFRATKNPRDRLLFGMMLTYGLRASEACGIKLADFSPSVERPVEVHINRLKDGVSRHYAISKDISQPLRSYIRQRGRKLHGWPDSPYLFPSIGTPKPMPYITCEKAMERLGEAAGLPTDLQHSHVWRHTCAVTLLSKGADVFFVKSWLGHKSISTTMVYANFMPSGWNRLQEAAFSALSF